MSQIDCDGFSKSLFDSIIDYKKNDSAIDKTDKYLYTRNKKKTKTNYHRMESPGGPEGRFRDMDPIKGYKGIKPC